MVLWGETRSEHGGQWSTRGTPAEWTKAEAEANLCMADESEEEEIIIRLKKPRLGVRRIAKIEVHSDFFLEGYGEKRLVHSSVDTTYPQDYNEE